MLDLADGGGGLVVAGHADEPDSEVTERGHDARQRLRLFTRTVRVTYRSIGATWRARQGMPDPARVPRIRRLLSL
jgi:hypothetical protein